MNIDEIKKNSPSGATHYFLDDDLVYYYKYNNGALMFFTSMKTWCFAHNPQVDINIEDYGNIKPL